MNKIEKLIKELCPKGVEFKALGELGSFFNGLSGKNKADFENGNARYISYMNVFSNIKSDLKANDFVKIKPNEQQNSIKLGDIFFTNSSETPQEVGMSCVVTKEPLEKIYLNSFCFGFRFDDENLLLPDFSKYLFRSESVRKQIIKTANGVTRFNISKTKFTTIQIPLPPLELQKEIVRILDAFTELERELERELELRKKQYEFYRNKLLSKEELEHRTAKLNPALKVEVKSLGEVFNIKNGYTPSKAKKEFWQNGTIPWFRMDDIRTNGRILKDSIQHITPQAVKGGKLFPANSIIIATTATIGEHALIIVDYLSNQQFTCLSLKSELSDSVDMKFMFYYGFILSELCKKNVNSSGFASVDMTKFKNFKIPIPPLEIQKQIVEILERFDSLTNSLTSGIPAELTGRKKQYVHYRERLLSFKNLAQKESKCKA